MNRQQVLELLPGYLDQELSFSESRECERYLEGSEECRIFFAQQRTARAELKLAALRLDAPQALLLRIVAALPFEISDTAQAAETTRKKPLVDRFRRRLGQFGKAGIGAPAWMSAGAMAMSVAVLGLSMGLYLAVPSREQRLTQELVDDHVRSLQSNHLFDVISSNQHTVKPWFNGKLDFAPPVIDLAQQGYPLLGGRLDFVDGRAVAVTVYRYKLHMINLYVWQGSDGGARPHVIEQQGYRVAHWSAARLTYWAITDAGTDELDGFVSNLCVQSAS
jgi:anti-sigma factor RsiW